MGGRGKGKLIIQETKKTIKSSEGADTVEVDGEWIIR